MKSKSALAANGLHHKGKFVAITSSVHEAGYLDSKTKDAILELIEKL